MLPTWKKKASYQCKNTRKQAVCKYYVYIRTKPFNAKWLLWRYFSKLLQSQDILGLRLGGNKVHHPLPRTPPHPLWLASGGLQVAYGALLMNSDSHAGCCPALWFMLLCGGPAESFSGCSSIPMLCLFHSSADVCYHAQNNNAVGFISNTVEDIKGKKSC